MTLSHNPPVVLCLSGHDPSGGAGIQADIEAVFANNAFAATVITCLTVQDSHKISALKSVDPDLLEQQAMMILKDYHGAIKAIKIGLLGSIDIARRVAKILTAYPQIPVVLDPVLAASGGGAEASQALSTFITQELLPLTTLITPNREEARMLSGQTSVADSAKALLATGCKAVLITGADEEKSKKVTNQLFFNDNQHSWQWAKLPGDFHGSGCTLAAAIAAHLAQGQSIVDAVENAQHYTWHSLCRAIKPGHGQAIPGRQALCNI